MIDFGKEYYSDNNYFFLKKRTKNIDVYFSVGNTLTEARDIDELVSVPLSAETNIKRLVEKIIKSKKKFSKSDIRNLIKKISPEKEEKEEIEELIDFDGTLNNSKIPIHDPTLSPINTMDTIVRATRIPGNPLTRGYRVYYGESLQREEDMSKAFGYEETKDLPPDETIEVLADMGVPDPLGRAMEFGKDPKLNKKKKKGADMRILTLEREKMIKVLEDILTKKSKDTDVQSKEINASKLLMKNLKTLKKMAEKEGLSNSDIIKLMKSE
jgi:hypothetical protein